LLLTLRSMTRMTDDPNPNPKNNSKNKSGELTDKYRYEAVTPAAR